MCETTTATGHNRNEIWEMVNQGGKEEEREHWRGTRGTINAPAQWALMDAERETLAGFFIAPSKPAASLTLKENKQDLI